MFKSSKFILVFLVVIIATVALFTSRATMAEWTFVVIAALTLYFGANEIQKKIGGYQFPNQPPPPVGQ
jgi:hypothetical protein